MHTFGSNNSKQLGIGDDGDKNTVVPIDISNNYNKNVGLLQIHNTQQSSNKIEEIFDENENLKFKHINIITPQNDNIFSYNNNSSLITTEMNTKLSSTVPAQVITTTTTELLNLDSNGNLTTNNIDISKNLKVMGNTDISGNVDISKNLKVMENADISGILTVNNVDISKNLKVMGNADISGDLIVGHKWGSGDNTTSVRIGKAYTDTLASQGSSFIEFKDIKNQNTETLSTNADNRGTNINIYTNSNSGE